MSRKKGIRRRKLRFTKIHQQRQRRRQRRRKFTGTPAPLPDRLQGVREKVFGATGVVTTIRYASDSMLFDSEGRPRIQDALRLVESELDDAATSLGVIIDEQGGASPCQGGDNNE